MHRRSTITLVLCSLTLLLSGCVTYHQPRYGHDGVYYEQTYRDGPARAAFIDPVIYPYWSLDYFYFSRHYTPYSVVVHRYDPWYYPYPGWYYGYRGRPGYSASFGYGYYPWHSFGIHYRHHRPWKPYHIHYPRPSRETVRYVERPATYQRVRQIDERMRALEQRQRSLAASSARPSDSRGAALSRSARDATTRSTSIPYRSQRIRSTTRSGSQPIRGSRSAGSQAEPSRESVGRPIPRVRIQTNPRLDQTRSRTRPEPPPTNQQRIERQIDRQGPSPVSQRRPPVRREAAPARASEPQQRSSPPTRSRAVERQSSQPSRNEPPARAAPSRSRQATRSEGNRRRRR